MKPFVINRYGRLVFPYNFVPELDFSVFETLEQFAAVIKRDFEEKAPTETEIAARVESRGYKVDTRRRIQGGSLGLTRGVVCGAVDHPRWPRPAAARFGGPPHGDRNGCGPRVLDGRHRDHPRGEAERGLSKEERPWPSPA
jgi:hypothetical protein